MHHSPHQNTRWLSFVLYRGHCIPICTVLLQTLQLRAVIHLPDRPNLPSIAYSDLQARVRVNGHLSDVMRQECPLSPLLFVLTLEPLLRRIRANNNIKEINVLGRTHKITSFADDILIFLTEPQLSIPNILNDFAHYKVQANLQINFSKSITYLCWEAASGTFKIGIKACFPGLAGLP